jgi:20S proteasome subunit beta 3
MQAPDELFEATSQALLTGLERDSLAGFGAVVYLITMQGVTARTLKSRMD